MKLTSLNLMKRKNGCKILVCVKADLRFCSLFYFNCIHGQFNSPSIYLLSCHMGQFSTE